MRRHRSPGGLGGLCVSEPGCSKSSVNVDMMARDTGDANGFYSPSHGMIHVALGFSPRQQAKTLAH